jgi:hypothetical protein
MTRIPGSPVGAETRLHTSFVVVAAVTPSVLIRWMCYRTLACCIDYKLPLHGISYECNLILMIH